MAKAAFSSASVPGLFPPYNWEGKGLFVDGGLASNLNIEDAILQCKELVEDDSQITVDILICQESQEVDEWEVLGKTASNYFRAKAIHNSKHGRFMVADALRAHPKVNFRYVLNQEEGFKVRGMLNFDGGHTWKLQEKGREQAKKALSAGEGAYFRLLMSEMKMEGF